MRVTHRNLNCLVTHESLHGPNVKPCHHEAVRESVFHVMLAEIENTRLCQSSGELLSRADGPYVNEGHSSVLLVPA